MEMQVESYLIEEVKELVVDAKSLDKWKEQCEKLGLEGQLSLASGEDKSPVPFPVMTTQQSRIYDELLPRHDNVIGYNKQAIPMRVLSLIALAEKENYFTEIYIHSDYEKPDPVVIGHYSTGKESWNHDKYIIARWGEELDSLPQLIDKAVKKKRTEAIAMLKDKISKCTAQMENLDEHLTSYFNGNSVSWEY